MALSLSRQSLSASHAAGALPLYCSLGLGLQPMWLVLSGYQNPLPVVGIEGILLYLAIFQLSLFLHVLERYFAEPY